MKNFGLSCVLLLSFVLPASAQSAQAGGILYGTDWACRVTAPSGWIMDQESWAQRGVFALFYEAGKELQAGIPIVYVTTQKLDAATDAELDKFVEWDIKNARKSKQNTVTERQLAVSGRGKVRVVDFNFNNDQFETIVFFRSKAVCFMVILATHDKAQITPGLKQLLAVTDSLKFIDKKAVQEKP